MEVQSTSVVIITWFLEEEEGEQRQKDYLLTLQSLLKSWRDETVRKKMNVRLASYAGNKKIEKVRLQIDEDNPDN